LGKSDGIKNAKDTYSMGFDDDLLMI
jgi:hypothetical protein